MVYNQSVRTKPLIAQRHTIDQPVYLRSCNRYIVLSGAVWNTSLVTRTYVTHDSVFPNTSDFTSYSTPYLVDGRLRICRNRSKALGL